MYFEFIRSINKYFDENSPWITVKDNLEVWGNTIYTWIYSIANLLSPFLLESSGKIKAWLAINEDRWETIVPKYGVSIEEVIILFERLDKKIIEEEKNGLLNYNNY